MNQCVRGYGCECVYGMTDSCAFGTTNGVQCGFMTNVYIGWTCKCLHWLDLSVKNACSQNLS